MTSCVTLSSQLPPLASDTNFPQCQGPLCFFPLNLSDERGQDSEYHAGGHRKLRLGVLYLG